MKENRKAVTDAIKGIAGKIAAKKAARRAANQPPTAQNILPPQVNMGNPY